MNDRDYGRELYPFLYQQSAASPAAIHAVLAEARQSTLQKCDDVIALRGQILHEYREALIAAASAMAERFARGGKLLSFGNGGSATDAHDAELDCLVPPLPHWRPLPALALTGDAGVLTAIANDVGFDRIFMRQVIAVGEPGDIALGFSTSGNSRNVIEGLAEARRRGLLTIAVSGNDGGLMAASGAVDHCFVARAEHIPRIQEGQATIWHGLLELVQAVLSEVPA